MKKILQSPFLLAILATLLCSNITLAQQATLIHYGSQWLYFDNQIQPANQGSLDWNDTGFNANATTGWDSGFAELGYDTPPDETTTINNANDATVTAYFRKEFVANLSTINSLELNLHYDDGAVVYLNGTEVLRPNMPTGAIDYNTVAETSHDGTETFPLPLNLLQQGTNVLAVEVHERSANSDDMSFDAELLCFGQLKVVRGPYLQTQTPTSMILKWRTNVATQSVVHYGTAQGALNMTVSNTVQTTEHEVIISGLNSSTVYFYDIANSATVLLPGAADLFFRTAPPAGTSTPLNAWILGDCGDAGNDDPADQQSVRNAYYGMFGGTGRTNDMILFLGDNAYDDGTDAEYQTAIFDNMYEDILQNTVAWSCLGNHDNNTTPAPYYDIFSFPTMGQAGGKLSGTEAYYSFDYGDIHFICLDSETYSQHAQAMLSWCEDDLSQTNARWIIAFWHHPPYSKGTHDSDEVGSKLEYMRATYLPLLEEYGVDLVLTGHSHIYERSFFLNGHYGNSNSFSLVNHTVGANGDGDGQTDGDGAYAKACDAEEGAVYVVTGSAGRVGNTVPGDHEAMFVTIPQLGSCRLSIAGDQLDLEFLSAENGVLDNFTIMKDCEEVDLCQCPNGSGQHLAADPVNGTNISTLVNGGGNLTNTCISVSGKLIIDNNGVNNATVAWNNVDVIMHPGAEIVVANLTRLDIINTSEVRGCTNMWKGITLGTNNSKLLVDFSTIRDAQYAVTVNNGSRISLFNSFFTANYVGIYAKSSSTLQNFRTITGSQSTGHWSNNTFQQGLGDLLPPYQGQSPTPGTRSFAGMYLKDVTNISTIFKQGVPNYFNGSQYGIYIDRGTNVSIHGVQISDLSPIVPNNQIGVYMLNSPGVFVLYSQIGSGVRVGIKNSNSGAIIRENNISGIEKGVEIRNVVNKSVHIRNNTNIRARTGIEIKNCQNSLSPTPFLPITITGNSSINAKTGVYIDDTHAVLTMSGNIINVDYSLWGAGAGYGTRILDSDGQLTVLNNQYFISNIPTETFSGLGIHLTNSMNCRIEDNIISGPTATNNLSDGIRVNSSTNNSFCCNTVDASRYGVNFNAICTGTALNNTLFNDHQIGLYLNFAQIGTQQNTRNNWINANTSSQHAKYSGNQQEIIFSVFTSNPALFPGDGPGNPPGDYSEVSVPFPANPSDWFTWLGSEITTCDDSNCGIALPWVVQNDPNTGLKNYDIHAATSLNTSDPVLKGLKWESQQRLYAKLKLHPGLIGTNNTVSSFYNSNSTGTLANFYDIKAGVKSAYQAGIAGTNYWTLINSLEGIIAQLDAQWILWQNATPTQKPAIEAQIQSLETSLIPIASDLNALDPQIAASRLQAINALIPLNEAIPTSEVYQHNEKDINRIFLNTVAQGIYTFTANQQTVIDGVAAQCPFIGGTSVYTARALQDLYNPQEYNDEQLCQAGGGRGAEKEAAFTKGNAVSIYPNPAKNNFTLLFAEVLTTYSRLSMVDLTGKVVFQHTLPSGLIQHQIESTPLAEGIYFYTVEDDNKQIISSGKIVISK